MVAIETSMENKGWKGSRGDITGVCVVIVTTFFLPSFFRCPPTTPTPWHQNDLHVSPALSQLLSKVSL